MFEAISGTILGVVLGLTVIEGGTIGLIVCVFGAFLLAQKPYLKALAAALIAFGATWLLLAARVALECAQVAGGCDGTDYRPFVLVAGLMGLGGIGLAVRSARPPIED